MKEFFMHIKGPEILNMWVGESERIVREIFATAREKRREGYLPFVFIDEAERASSARAAPDGSTASSARWCRCFARRWTVSKACTTPSSSSPATART
jgi:SpoVK/Ycf46/Vps4 family AAA+-type ATPase